MAPSLLRICSPLHMLCTPATQYSPDTVLQDRYGHPCVARLLQEEGAVFPSALANVSAWRSGLHLGFGPIVEFICIVK